MAVIAQGKRLREVLRQRLEPAEVSRLPRFVESAKPNAFGPTPVEEARDLKRERRRVDFVVEVGSKLEDPGIRTVSNHHR